MNRRQFGASLGAALSAAAKTTTTTTRFSKGICSTVFPKAMPFEERVLAAKNAGFEGIELPLGGDITLDSPGDQVKRTADTAHGAGITIVSLWLSGPLADNPLNSPDADRRAKGAAVVRRALEIAHRLGCGALLLIPGRLGEGPKFNYGYQDSWDRITGELRGLAPAAEKARVIITPENVWNKFLVSPLEMRAFVDQFHSPWVQTHFDVGNVMQFGYPQDWILTLGQRIKRVHFKDYKLSTRAEQGRFVDLLEGDVDWKEVMAALTKIGYHGFISPEIDYNPNDAGQLMEVSRRLDKILAMG